LHAAHGHIQEVIVQNFRAKPATRPANSDEPDLDDLLWTIATARLILGPRMNIQAPSNLSPGVHQKLIDAGLNDWGGISPVTPDHVNPEAPWSAIAELARESADAGKLLVNRLPVYPATRASPIPGSLPISPPACNA
jgi:FO synthase